MQASDLPLHMPLPLNLIFGNGVCTKCSKKADYFIVLASGKKLDVGKVRPYIYIQYVPCRCCTTLVLTLPLLLERFKDASK